MDTGRQMTMKKFSALALIFAAFAANAQYNDSPLSDLYQSEVVTSMKDQVGFLASAALEGRKAGSEGEKEAAVYFSEVLSPFEGMSDEEMAEALSDENFMSDLIDSIDIKVMSSA